MEDTQPLNLNHTLAVIGDGALLIWWGLVILIDPITIAMGAIGSGLIMLAVNAARLLSRIPTKASTTYLGLIALTWGVLATLFNAGLGLAFALLLIVAGLATLGSLLQRAPAA